MLDPTRSASGSRVEQGPESREYATVGIGEEPGGSIADGGGQQSGRIAADRTLVSGSGCAARPSTDTLGPIGRSVKDVAIVST